MKPAIITLGGGCFWCLDAVYREVPGVITSVCGYAGGAIDNPDYKAVCGGHTGHAEVVELTFDNQQVSLHRLLDIFFTIHDPTTLNRQGHDVGTQYRSVIFYHDESQHEAVLNYLNDVMNSGRFAQPIVTEVAPAPKFWVAEDYHQDYFRHNPYQGYCMAVVAPKLEKYRQMPAGA